MAKFTLYGARPGSSHFGLLFSFVARGCMTYLTSQGMGRHRGADKNVKSLLFEFLGPAM